MNLIIGLLLIAIALVLLFIGRPNKTGQHARFLQFEASMMLYPPLVLVFFVMGAAAIITSLLGLPGSAFGVKRAGPTRSNA